LDKDMLAKEKNRRQDELEQQIRELSKKLFDGSEIRNISLQLLEIYKGDFRHSYSGFFPLIQKISESDQQESLDFLGDNLESIRAYIEEDFVSGKKEFEDIYDQLNKLCDHLTLEIGRWNYYSKNEQKIEDLNAKTAALNVNIDNASRELQKASKQASSIQTELIAVLSIFAAIVVTFSGGFTFLGGVMTSIGNVDDYEIVVLVAIICGMVIFNTIFLLMYLVGKITERNIYAKCKTGDCSCKNKCGNLGRIRKRLPYVFYFNLVCIIGIIINFIVWYMDIRNWLGL